MGLRLAPAPVNSRVNRADSPCQQRCAKPAQEEAEVREETPILIVGGSLVGLTSAMLLGDLGVPSLVVERHAGTAIHARAGHFQLGTTEMLRQVGLERTVREASARTYH